MCGYDPATNPMYKDKFFEAAPKSGHPKKLDKQQTKALLDLIRKDHHGQEMSALDISEEFPVSPCTIQ